MGFRYRRSVNAGPIRFNFSKRGVGYSIGIPGCRVSTYADGRRYLVLSLPGTGISWWKQLRSSAKKQAAYPNPNTIPQGGQRSGKGKPPPAPPRVVIASNPAIPVASTKVRPRIRFK